jgi:tetratricopeptide (TPR) repeat protein
MPILQIDPQKERQLRSVAALILVAVVLGLLVVMIHGNPIGGLLWSGACLFAGALVGFLFGIPKTVSDPKAIDSQKVNTNLEDISDWMTKIIVGLGLAEIKSIPPYLQSAAGYIAFTWGDSAANRAFGYALLLYFSVVGFLGGYLLTRTFLSPLLKTIDSPLRQFVGGGQPLERQLSAAIGASGVSSTASDPDAAEATAAFLSAYTDLEKKAGQGTLKMHIQRLTALKARFPVFRMLHIVLARLYRAIDNYDAGIAVLNEFIQNKEKAGTSDDADTAAAYYNRACYEVLKARNVDPSTKQPLIEAALADLREAFKRSPEYEDYANEDSDLTDIKDSIASIQ